MNNEIASILIYDEKEKEKQRKKEHNEIILLYSSKQQEEWYNLLKANGIVPLENGWLNIRKWNKTETNTLKVGWQKIIDIDHAIRMQDNILKKYKKRDDRKKSELSRIKTVEELITYANSLLINWVTISDKNNIGLALLEVVSCLSRCRNEFSKNTREQAKHASTIIDSRGRTNPGAMAARTIAALNSISKRMSQLGIIIPFIAMRKEILILERNRMLSEMSKTKSVLKATTKHVAFGGKRISKPQLWALDKKIGQLINQLEQIHISPFFEQAQFTIEHLKKAKSSLKVFSFLEAKELLTVSINILEIEL